MEALFIGGPIHGEERDVEPVGPLYRVAVPELVLEIGPCGEYEHVSIKHFDYARVAVSPYQGAAVLIPAKDADEAVSFLINMARKQGPEQGTELEYFKRKYAEAAAEVDRLRTIIDKAHEEAA